MRRVVVRLVVLSLVAAAASGCCDGSAAECSKEDTFYYLFLKPHMSAIIYFLLPVAYLKLSRVVVISAG